MGKCASLQVFLLRQRTTSFRSSRLKFRFLCGASERPAFWTSCGGIVKAPRCVCFLLAYFCTTNRAQCNGERGATPLIVYCEKACSKCVGEYEAQRQKLGCYFFFCKILRAITMKKVLNFVPLSIGSVFPV